MTYSQYGQVQSTDYNGFVSTGTPNFNGIWSTLYGQTALSTVSAYQNVASNPWDNLVNGIANAASHQGTSITAVTPPAQYGIVAYISSVSTNLSSINTGKYNAAAVGTDITTTATRSTNWGLNVSIPTVTSTITVTFGSAAQAGYFFNLGGTVRVSCSRSGGTGTPEDTAWTNLCSAIGTLALPSQSTAQTIVGTGYQGLTKIGGSGTPATYTRTGFVGLNGTPAILFKQYASASAYTSDYIQLSYSVSGAVLTITAQFTDANATAPITGNLQVTATARPPESTYVSNTWGTPVVAVSAPA